MKIKSKYKWYKNPFKYFAQRKYIQLMNLYVENNPEIMTEVYQLQNDILLYGNAFLKNGKRVRPDIFDL